MTRIRFSGSHMRAPGAHVSKRTTEAPRNEGVLPCRLRASRISHTVVLATSLFAVVCGMPAGGVSADVGPFMATGFKVGEVTSHSAIIWTRLTRNARRNSEDRPMVKILYAKNAQNKSRRNEVVGLEYPDGTGAGDLPGAAPGMAGQVRVNYRPAGSIPWQQTAWTPVDPKRDFTCQFTIDDLKPNSHYQLRVESRAATGDVPGESLDGKFITAPKPDDPARVVFTVSTGQAYKDRDLPAGYKIYPLMLKLDPSFFVHTGDIVYYDRLAKSPALARYHWQRTYSLPTNVDFHRQVASYFLKDDHDTFMNDCWPSMQTKYMYQLTFKEGQEIFRYEVPMGASTYRTRRWGKDLQIWMVEGRDFRSPNNAPDGPGKTIWGARQIEWFKRTVKASDATFRILISPTPMVGPDRANKHDNYANKNFTYEGDLLRKFIASQRNMVVVCGDRHWQYLSVHPTTKVREYSCGPASDKHAGGWKDSDFRPEYHRYLHVIGGFLAATVARENGVPTLTFRWYNTQGKVEHEDRLQAGK